MVTNVHHIRITVTNLNRAINFYGHLLGLEYKSESGARVFYDCGGVDIELTTADRVERPRLGEPVTCFCVDDIQAVYALLRNQGVYFIHPPKEIEPRTFKTAFTDPDGNNLELIQLDSD